MQQNSIAGREIYIAGRGMHIAGREMHIAGREMENIGMTVKLSDWGFEKNIKEPPCQYEVLTALLRCKADIFTRMPASS